VAIKRLTAAEPDHYAIWVLKAPYPGGYVHHDRIWLPPLTQTWEAWQSLFCLRGLPEIPRIPPDYLAQPELAFMVDLPDPTPGQPPPSRSSRLMQQLGVSLWKWLFDGPIQSSLSQSQGVAIGQGRPLRLRLEIHDPDLIAMPWEIMQPESGMQAVSLSQQLLFSRTTSAVGSLPPLRTEQTLKILLVLGQDNDEPGKPLLKLEQEAIALSQILEQSAQSDLGNSFVAPVPCEVKALLQPTVADLTTHLETENYNVFFYSGHGIPAADGGLLFYKKMPPSTVQNWLRC